MCSPALPLVLCQSSTFSQLDRERLASSFATRPDDSQEQFVSSSFIDLGVPADLVAALDSRGITDPFEVQAATIPDIFAGRDVCGRAPTGSGKTLAFGIPLVAMVGKAKPRRPRALVLAPTRELAAQITRELAPLAAVRGPHRVLRLRRRRLRAAAPGAAPRRRHPRRLSRPSARPRRAERAAPRLDHDGRDRRSRPHGRHGLPPAGAQAPRRDERSAPDDSVLGDARRRRRGVDARVPEQRDEARGRRGRARHHRRRPPLLEGRAGRPQRARRRSHLRRRPHDRVLPHAPRRRPRRAGARQERRTRGRDPRWS